MLPRGGAEGPAVHSSVGLPRWQMVERGRGFFWISWLQATPFWHFNRQPLGISSYHQAPSYNIVTHRANGSTVDTGGGTRKCTDALARR